MTQTKCVNHIICSQFINKNINNSYCKDCLFYFNYTLIIKKNKLNNLLRCPICLESPTLFIKQKLCDHYICSNCIYNIYFDKTYIRNMPKNPVFKLNKSWDLFIYGNQSYKFKTKIIDMFDNYNMDDKLYDYLIRTNKYYIPNLFKKDLKELIKFQLEKNKYIKEYQDDKYKKINIIKVCPYCRKSEFNNIMIEPIDNLINNPINSLF